MANKKAAMKALRQSTKLRVKNAKVIQNVVWLTKKAGQAVASKSADARELAFKFEQAVDKAVQKGVIKENTGRRKKSRFMARYNTAFGGKK